MAKYILIGYLAMVLIMSLVAIVAYSNDKKKAVKGAERTKEKILLFFGVFFGALGSLIGRIIAHHKTDKSYFSIVIYFSLLTQVATLAYLAYIAFVLL